MVNHILARGEQAPPVDPPQARAVRDRHLHKPVSFRPTQLQRAELERRAAEAGLTVSAYVLAALDLPPDGTMYRRRRKSGSEPGAAADAPPALVLDPAAVATLRDLLGQLGKLGNNVNQLARAAHLGQLRDGSDVGPALLDELRTLTRAIIRALGRPVPSKGRK